MLNYSKVKEVEKELATLQFQLKLASGPKRSALEMFRKKIEAQNACVVAAKDRHRAAKKVPQQWSCLDNSPPPTHPSDHLVRYAGRQNHCQCSGV